MTRSLRESSILNTVEYRSLSVGVVPSSEYLIETIVLGSNTASVTFSDLAQYAGVYRHLQVVASFRSSASTGTTSGGMRFNGDSGNNYVLHTLEGNGSSVLSGASTGQNQMLLMVGGVPGANNTAGNFGVGIFDIIDPYQAKNKTVRVLQGLSGSGPIRLNSGLWINTASLTSITLLPQSGDWVQHSRFSLYGVTA